MPTIFLALGSNIGDRAANLRQAIALLETIITCDARSSVYETAPMYVTDQPPFLNMVVRGHGDLDPPTLLARVKAMEVALGRTPGRRYGPRQIDIDILTYDALVLRTTALEIPHPRLTERAFVLCPLAELAPDWRLPGSDTDVAALLATLPDIASVRRLGPLSSIPGQP